MTTEERANLRAVHVYDEAPGEHYHRDDPCECQPRCRWDGEEYPCTTLRLLGEFERTETVLRAIVKKYDRETDDCDCWHLDTADMAEARRLLGLLR